MKFPWVSGPLLNHGFFKLVEVEYCFFFFCSFPKYLWLLFETLSGNTLFGKQNKIVFKIFKDDNKILQFFFDNDTMSLPTENITVEKHGDFTVQDMKAKAGMFTQKGQLLYSLKEKSTGNVHRIKAQKPGKPLQILKKTGTDVSHG